MVDGSDRGEPSNLRGRLSDIYLPALLSRETGALTRRLGDRATVDDPLFGRASGAPEVPRRLDEIAAWLADRHGSFERSGFVMGSDRDITEGQLIVTIDGRRTEVPVAVVAERRPERVVRLRVYYSTQCLGQKNAARAPLLDPNEETAVPPPVATYLDALARGDLAAVNASFEDGAAVRDGVGRVHVKDAGGGSLDAYYGKLIGAAGAHAGIQVVKNARADDGRACALEYTVIRVRGRDVIPRAGFAVFERGESGLLRALRIYDEVDTEDGG